VGEVTGKGGLAAAGIPQDQEAPGGSCQAGGVKGASGRSLSYETKGGDHAGPGRQHHFIEAGRAMHHDLGPGRSRAPADEDFWSYPGGKPAWVLKERHRVLSYSQAADLDG
jgi:hypothetical protein